MITEPNTLQRIRDRDRELAEARKHLPPVTHTRLVKPERVTVALPRVTIDQATRARADELMRAEEAEKKVQQWRANLKKYAPIADWEHAWNAKPMPDHDPRVPHPDFFAGSEGVFRWLGDGCKKHLVILGAIGSGKSIGAAVAVRKWVEPGIGFNPVCWMTADQLVSAMFHQYSDESPKLCRYNVIDDVGDERKDDFEEALAKALEMQDVTFVMTSNLALRHKDQALTFRGRYKRGRLIDRMRATCTTVVVPGGSRRDQSGGF